MSGPKYVNENVLLCINLGSLVMKVFWVVEKPIPLQAYNRK